jgi:dethiobiotin synthetase
LPLIIVTRPDLGTINHTLLTIDAAKNAGLAIAGLVISGYNAETAGLAEETLPEVLEEWGQVPVLSIIPYDEESDVENGKLGELTIEALTDCDWAEML